MNSSQIRILEDVIQHRNTKIPVAFIADSPWIPGYCGHGFVDYYTRNAVWLKDNRKIISDFPDAIFVPGWWVEYGMTAEPTAAGCRVCFYDDNLPHLHPITEDMEKLEGMIDEMALPNPKVDGLMPFLLNQQRYVQPIMEAEGEEVYMVCARGPFTVASHMITVTQLLMLIMTAPEVAEKLLRKTTLIVKTWLEAQLETVCTAKAIMVLDDVCGYFGPEDFVQSCMPYMKEIFAAFPECRHFFHNDFTSSSCYPYLEEMGVDAFNFTHMVDIAEARRLTGPKVVLMGNVPPMLLTGDNPQEVYSATRSVLENYLKENGGPQGLLLSTGGGLPMGAKKENIDALMAAVKDINAKL